MKEDYSKIKRHLLKCSGKELSEKPDKEILRLVIETNNIKNLAKSFWLENKLAYDFFNNNISLYEVLVSSPENEYVLWEKRKEMLICEANKRGIPILYTKGIFLRNDEELQNIDKLSSTERNRRTFDFVGIKYFTKFLVYIVDDKESAIKQRDEFLHLYVEMTDMVSLIRAINLYDGIEDDEVLKKLKKYVFSNN